MAARTQSRPERTSDTDLHQHPEISVYESSPGNAVFVESDNTDGWIASDVTVDVVR